LGLLREDKLTRFLPKIRFESIREQIDSRTSAREKISTAIDLPLSTEGKRALAYAAEEADRLDHKHIGTEHLLLELLHEENSLAADTTRAQGRNFEPAARSRETA
jgi:ATP-dependent Clp protease ATP-binding subunit ClpC